MDTDLRKLLEIWINEEDASPAELERLTTRLKEDNALRKAFVAELSMLGKLRAVQSSEPRWRKLDDEIGAGPEREDTFELQVMRQFDQMAAKRAGKSQPNSKRWWFAAAAILVFGALLWMAGQWQGGPNRDSAPLGAPVPFDDGISPLPSEITDAVAIISRVSQAVWANGERLKPGDSLSARALDLEKGLVQLDFYGGAHLIVQGPASLELRHSREVYLESGAAGCYVSQLGRGFRVVTDDGEVTDRGTSFSMSSGGGGPTRVMVVEGAASVAGQFVEAGSAVSVDRGKLSEIPFSLEGLPRPNEFRRRKEARDANRFKVWQRSSARLSADPGVLLHYTMEGQGQSGPEIVNRAKTTHPGRASNAAILGTSWTSGRWAGKSAIHFSHEDDRLLARLPGAYPQLTFLVWAKVDALTQAHSAFILAEMPHRWSLNGSIEPGELKRAIERRAKSAPQIVRWTGYAPQQDMRFSIAFKGKTVKDLTWDNYSCREGVLESRRWGQWACYAVTYDAEHREVKHYFNGRMARRHEIARPEPLPLDFLEIGNLSTNQEEKNKRVQYRFYGLIDEILIAKRAFSTEEVQHLFEAGRP